MTNNKQDDFFDGIGLSLGFIIAGIIFPFLFTNKFIMTIAIFLIVFGIMGFGIELDKLYKDFGYTNIFMGFGTVLLGTSMLLLFPNFIIKLFFLILILAGIFAIVSGGLKWWYLKKQTKQEKVETQKSVKYSNIKVFLSGISSVTGFIANIVTIISFFY